MDFGVVIAQTGMPGRRATIQALFSSRERNNSFSCIIMHATPCMEVLLKKNEIIRIKALFSVMAKFQFSLDLIKKA